MTKNRALIYLSAVIVGLLTLRQCERRKTNDETSTAPILKENEKQKIVIDTTKRQVRTVRRDNSHTAKGGASQAIKTVEGVRKTIITVDEDNTVHVRAINKGLTLEPGLTLYYSDRARLGLDVQVAYWKRWGVLLGAGVNMGDEPRTVRGHVAIAYALPLDFISNTSVFVGVDHHKDLAVGMRIRF